MPHVFAKPPASWCHSYLQNLAHSLYRLPLSTVSLSLFSSSSSSESGSILLLPMLGLLAHRQRWDSPLHFLPLGAACWQR